MGVFTCATRYLPIFWVSKKLFFSFIGLCHGPILKFQLCLTNEYGVWFWGFGDVDMASQTPPHQASRPLSGRFVTSLVDWNFLIIAMMVEIGIFNT